MIIHKFISPYRDCNNYLIEFENNNYIGIDIGSIDVESITSVINRNSGNLLAYFLTHAHGDHTVGIQQMWDMYQMPVYCSADTAADLKNCRKNFSLYSAEIPTFEYNLPVTVVSDEQEVIIGSEMVTILSTPGHSPGCTVFVVKDNIFTGDFAMADFKTPLTLPNSSKSAYSLSVEKFRNFCIGKKLTFHPGHGNIFTNIDQVLQ